MKKVAVLQSNYIPWKGYFDLINDADEFIFYDDLQFTKNDWRNRNKFKTVHGSKWLSIPVGTSGNRLICDVTLKDSKWQRAHWDSLQQQYRKSVFFKQYSAIFESIYLEQQWSNLAALNHHLIKVISLDILGVDTCFKDSRNFSLTGQKLDRLIDLVGQSQATHYISGPAAKGYIEPQRFADIGVELIWKDYTGYPEYPQAHPPFEHAVTILDLLFNVGPAAPWYIWGWRGEKAAS